MVAIVKGKRLGDVCAVRSEFGEGALDRLFEWFNEQGEGYTCTVYDGVEPDASVVADWST